MGICSDCKKGPREINYRHPLTQQPICHTCYFKTPGKAHKKKRGICPVCQKGPRSITYCHPVTKKNVCSTCYLKATGNVNKRKRGICPICQKGPRDITCRHPITQENICITCHQRAKSQNDHQATSQGVVEPPKRERQESKTATPKEISKPVEKVVAVVPSFPQERIEAKEVVRSVPSYRPPLVRVPERKNVLSREEQEKLRLDCCHFLDAASSQNPQQLNSLSSLIKEDPEKVRRILVEIFRPSLSEAAKGIIRRFLQTKEGKKLKSII